MKKGGDFLRQKVFTFIMTLLVWIILSGKISKDVLLLGSGAAMLSTFLFSDMLFRLSKRKTRWINYIYKIVLISFFIPVFFYEALVAALKVSKHAFEKEPSFSPGIVKVKTTLTNVSALSLLANLVTLTPGTLTLDFDTSERAFYIHWIDVRTREEAETRKEIIERFEKWLGVIFQ